MFLDISTVAQNVTEIATQYTAQQISDAANELILNAFIKIGIGIFASAGLARLGRELKGLILTIDGFLGVWATIDLIRAFTAVMTQTMP